MFDNSEMFYNAILTANQAGSFVNVGHGFNPLVLRTVVPSLAETDDAIDIVVTLSDDGTNAKEVYTLPQITYAGVVTNKITEYLYTLPMHRKYIKVAVTVTDADTGTDFTTTTAFQCGLVPAGRHNVR